MFSVNLSDIASGLQDLGYGIAANAAYDFLKKKLFGRQQVTGAEFKQAIDEFLILKGVQAHAPNVMELLANKGLLGVAGSQLHADDKLSIAADSGATFVVRDNTQTSTTRTAINVVGTGAIVGSDAAIVQEDGDISFRVGKKS